MSICIAVLNPIVAIGAMLSHPFMDYAYLAGTAIAVASGLVGYFVVLRSQVFTGDALSHVAFAGALGALAFGANLRVGLFVSCVAVALLFGLLGPRGRPDDVVIGSVFAWILGLGVLFLSIYTTNYSAGENSTAGVNVLFGSIFGLNKSEALVALVIAAVVALGVLGLGRPLLFSSLDPEVARAFGVPTRLVGLCFLALVGASTGEATQAVGALLVLGLIAAPAGAACQLTDRPWRAMTYAVAIALSSMWGGLALSYGASVLPPSFSILAIATAWQVGAWCFGTLGRRHGPASSPGSQVMEHLGRSNVGFVLGERRAP